MISATLILFIIIAVWVVTFVLGLALKNPFLSGIAGVTGILLGIRMLTQVDRILGFIILGIALYQLYRAAFEETKKK